MVEVADVFRNYGQAYRKEHSLPYHTHKVINAIQSCRTAVLGGHKDKCNACGHIRVSYNSCRNGIALNVRDQHGKSG
ncbi:Transposase zinc-binding domain-containing protein [Desulfotomaculum arcticum]|uniref:Transposase zinc-binding domain-containing protein n=1 Tax=Desulfotruncus arcticus DSM 17038 TaxID=1121424 RepID=A0A1I2YJF5_9FIRM|nr:transposase zinc-binding domain-containing protein [Desulfotruncus arcticus]SFH25657.1 Transposase zinc-binding domain-containing protein [Desulfotomaculum arcticum] [Desulfotruncus arcticus DSM 17038]